MTENTTASGAADRVTELLPELLKLVQAQRAYIHAMPAVTADAFHAMPGFDGDWAAEIEARAVEALAASAPVAPAPQPVPDGFVLVPVEPTPEMVRAAYSGPMQGGLLAAVPKAALVHTRNSGDVEQHAALQQGEYLPLQGLAAYLHAESVGVCTCTPHETLRKWAIEVDRVSRGAAQAAPAPVTHPVIAGALFDFLGHLTTLKTPVSFGSSEEASPAVEHLQIWAKLRNLQLDEAKVMDWSRSAAPVAEDAIALLSEVAHYFTGNDDLPNDLLPRIDALLDAQAAQPEGGA